MQNEINVIWSLPIMITLLLIGVMFRPYQSFGDYDFGLIFRLFWLIPLGFVWAVFFACLYFWG